MNTPIAALLWPEHARQDPAALLRLLAFLERECLDLGAEEAAGHLAEATAALLRDTTSRRLAA
ncbi:soj family protein [Roseomonas sp. BN140053]|uniref:soj family protein n=1 Tax=Roseomonas sp. BN140053 TaxID=3391898 RepID=UPI0039E93B37